MALYFYLAFLLIFPILGFLSRGETVFTAEKLSAVQMPFEKMAVYLFRKTEKLPLFAGHRRFLRPGAVRADLRTLDPSRGIEVREQCYFIRKIRYLLLFLFLADTIALLLWFSRKNESVIGEGGRLARPFYGEAGSEQELGHGGSGGGFSLSESARGKSFPFGGVGKSRDAIENRGLSLSDFLGEQQI